MAFGCWTTPGCQLCKHPKPDALMNIITDGSDIAVGAVLQQLLWSMAPHFILLQKVKTGRN